MFGTTDLSTQRTARPFKYEINEQELRNRKTSDKKVADAAQPQNAPALPPRPASTQLNAPRTNSSMTTSISLADRVTPKETTPTEKSCCEAFCGCFGSK